MSTTTATETAAPAVLALTVEHNNGARTVWAFGDPVEFRAAAALLEIHGVRHALHHGRTDAGRWIALDKARAADAEWLAESEGLNECGELYRCLFERGEIPRGPRVMSFRTFQLSARQMDSHTFGRMIGDAMHDDAPAHPVRVYAGCYWISQRPDGGYHLEIERDEWTAAPGDAAGLARLEAEAYAWALEEGQLVEPTA